MLINTNKQFKHWKPKKRNLLWVFRISKWVWKIFPSLCEEKMKSYLQVPDLRPWAFLISAKTVPTLTTWENTDGIGSQGLEAGGSSSSGLWLCFFSADNSLSLTWSYLTHGCIAFITTVLLLYPILKMGEDSDLGQLGHVTILKLMPVALRLGILAVPAWSSCPVFTQSLAGKTAFC